MNRLRVAHVVNSLDLSAGSPAILTAGLIPALQQIGIDAEISTPRESSASLAGADLVHIHGWGGEHSASTARQAWAARKPFVVSPLGALDESDPSNRTWSRSLRFWLNDRRLLSRAGAVTALNAREYEHLSSRRVNKNLVMMPYGISLNDYAEIQNRPGLSVTGDAAPSAHGTGRTLLMLGSLDPLEGCIMLLRALGELATEAEGWSVVLAGPEDPHRRKMLDAAIRRKGGGDRVQMVPAADLTQIKEWLGRATVLVAPSLCVRSPVSILQAAAGGVPVLASTAVLPPEANDGIRHFAPTREDLKAALRTVLAMRDDELADWGRKGLSLAAARYDWSVVAPRFGQLYESVLASHQHGSSPTSLDASQQTERAGCPT